MDTLQTVQFVIGRAYAVTVGIGVQDQVTCRIVGVGCQAGIWGSFRYAIAKVVVGIRCYCAGIGYPRDVIIDTFGFYSALYLVDLKDKLKTKINFTNTHLSSLTRLFTLSLPLKRRLKSNEQLETIGICHRLF